MNQPCDRRTNGHTDRIAIINSMMMMSIAIAYARNSIYAVARKNRVPPTIYYLLN